jgi:hypothetical protein
VAPSETTVTLSYDLAGRLIGASDTSAAIAEALGRRVVPLPKGRRPRAKHQRRS